MPVLFQEWLEWRKTTREDTLVWSPNQPWVHLSSATWAQSKAGHKGIKSRTFSHQQGMLSGV